MRIQQTGFNQTSMISQLWNQELFLIECRKTKTKAITVTNHSKRKQRNEPMRTRSKNT